jgi:hypothetical protein
MDIVLDGGNVYLPVTEEARRVQSVVSPENRVALLDVKIVDPYADSWLKYAKAGPAAMFEAAYEVKMDQYMPRDAAGRAPVFNATRHSFFPLVFDTFGAWHPLARQLFQAVSQAQADKGGDVWAAGRHMVKWRQIVSLTLLRAWTHALEKGMRAAKNDAGSADMIRQLALFAPA